jgi:hypothetical protein
MTITTVDALVSALGNSNTEFLIDKASIANAAAGQFHSLFRATGQPGQGAIPTGAAVCSSALTGAVGFTAQTAPATSYLGSIEASCGNAATTLQIHDRLVHIGGLSGTVTTAQTVSIDLSTLLGTSNLDARKGAADYSNVMWWLEWYADTGATVATATVNVTYDNGSTGNLTGVALAATRRASFMQPLNSLIPAADSGKFIRGVNNVTLSATTGTAGNFGVTATRPKATVFQPLANVIEERDWSRVRMSEIPNAACLMLVQLASTTSTGAVRGLGKIIHG